MAVKVLCVFGTRPEAIKMAPVVMELKRSPKFKTRVCVTGQHRKMLDEVLELFRIKPDHDLNVMAEGQSLEHIFTSVLARLAPVIQKEKPDVVLVHGDTSTAFLASLAAFYQRIPVGHVEAGLRSYDMAHPFPEEANRRLSDALTVLHFAPTPEARRNLLKENIPAGGIFVTGNTVIDALKWAVGKAGKPRASSRRTILVTAHRRENLGKPLENICRALRKVADAFPDVEIVYPVHLNPKVQAPAKKFLGNHPRIKLLPPVGYLELARLLESCHLVVTDSGGLQEEAPFLSKPVLVLRKVTERPEAVRAGVVRVIGSEQGRIVREVSRLLKDKKAYRAMARGASPYGDGRASGRIAQAILSHFNKSRRPPDFAP